MGIFIGVDHIAAWLFMVQTKSLTDDTKMPGSSLLRLNKHEVTHVSVLWCLRNKMSNISSDSQKGRRLCYSFYYYWCRNFHLRVHLRKARRTHKTFDEALRDLILLTMKGRERVNTGSVCLLMKLFFMILKKRQQAPCPSLGREDWNLVLCSRY